MTGSGTAHDEQLAPVTPDPETEKRLAGAFVAAYRGAHDDSSDDRIDLAGADDPASAERVVSRDFVRAHHALGARRAPGQTSVAAIAGDDGSGIGPALQIVTEQAPLLMDSVTVLLHRLGVAYRSISNPVFRVRRDADGDIEQIAAAGPDGADGGSDETWIYIQLAGDSDRDALAEAQRLLPDILADARQVALDSDAMVAAMQDLAASRVRTAGTSPR